MKRARVCARDMQAGPGTCSYWWDTCPANVAHCWIRYAQENRHLVDALPEEQKAAMTEWEKQRDIAAGMRGDLL